MILTRAPLRASFFGGGSDIYSHYSRHGGAVLSAAIDKYMYVAVNPTVHNYIRLSYSEVETVQTPEELEHDIARNILKSSRYRPTAGIEISSFADIPTAGTGLGSSSTYACALLKALDPTLSHHDLANEAAYVEINLCGSPIGLQDQYAASYGGFNYIQFNDDDSVEVTPITTDTKLLQDNLFLYYIGIKRSANSILSDQAKRASSNADMLNHMVNQSKLGLQYVVQARYHDFGALMHEAWQAKKSLTPLISNDVVDEYYKQAINSGALGGKLLGAGGGGYMMFYVPPENQDQFKKSMALYDDLTPVSFSFSPTGTEVLYDSNSR